jgi:hypothetical protein
LGKLVLHHCDNPACCNPPLRIGTQSDNLSDMLAKRYQWSRELAVPNLRREEAVQATIVSWFKALCRRLVGDLVITPTIRVRASLVHD